MENRNRSAAAVTASSRSCTMTLSALVVASAAIRCSFSGVTINRPRSAPACSMAVRRSVSSSCPG